MFMWWYLSLTLLSSSVLGQGQTSSSALELLPACGRFCLSSALTVTSCAPNNQTCLCEDQQFAILVEECVLQTCTVKEQLTTKNATEASCGRIPRDKGTQLYINTIVLGTITGLVVVARLAFRLFISKAGFGVDDWSILATLLIGLPGTVVICVGTYPNGVGKDVWTLRFDQITNFLFWFYISEIQYFINLAALKLSLLLFYLRIFPDPLVRRLLTGTVVFDILFGAGFAGATFFQCIPMDYFWHMWDGEHQGHCFNINAMGWANAAISILLDLWMLALPLWQLKGLHLHWKKKAGVALMFVVGTFVTVVSVLRLQALVAFATSTNFTWDNYDVHFWSTIEINVGIICACMPAVRQMLVWLFPVVFGATTMRETYGSGMGHRHNVPRSKASADRALSESRQALNRPSSAMMWDLSVSNPSLKHSHSRKELRWAVSVEDVKLKKLSSVVIAEDDDSVGRNQVKSGIIITETGLERH